MPTPDKTPAKIPAKTPAKIPAKIPAKFPAKTPAVVLALATVLVGILLAFALPAIKSAPHNVPIGVVAPAPVAAQVEAGIAAKAPGAFAVTAYDTPEHLTDAIKRRDVYGGLVVSTSGPQLLTASAASPAIAQTLTALGNAIASGQGLKLTVTDVVAPPAEDPRGLGLTSGLLPLFLGSLAPVVVLTTLVKRPVPQFVTVVGAALVFGFSLAAVLHFGLGAFAGSYLLEGAAMASVLLAMSLTLGGLRGIGGMPAFGLGAATFLILGNPLSGASTAPEYLTGFWGWLGQVLPPGAGAQVLRSAAYFDGVGATHGWIVLSSWMAFGVFLYAVSVARSSRQEPEVAPATA
mgnify:CR=1 FL=1